MTYKRIAIALSLSVFASTAWAGAANMKEGLWEITSRTEVPGMPAGMKMPGMTLQHCFTSDEISRNQAIKPDKQSDCKMTNMQQSGNAMSWTMECSGKHASRIEGKGVFNGDNYSVTNTIRFLNGRMKGQAMATNVSAKRLGGCKK